MERHINIVATLRITLSILGLFFALIIPAVLKLIGSFSGDHQADMVLSIIANALSVFFIVLSLPGIIGGIGLLKRKEWARILVLIISVLDLFNFPFGTAVGAYSIWALVQPEVVAQFGKNQTEGTNLEQ